MALYGDFDRYHAEKQHHQRIRLLDPEESIQSKLPVSEGELILTQTRLYIARDGHEGDVPNVRLERVRVRTYPEDRYLEVAPRMGAFLSPGQTGAEFLKMIELWRKPAMARIERASRDSREGIRRRYDSILETARAQDRDGHRRKAKDTLRNLHTAHPDRRDAAVRLGELYLEEGNFRSAAIWLARGRVFDERFDRALGRVIAPRLPSRESPPPEWWIDRRLGPLLELPGTDGPTPGQRDRVREARTRIERFRGAAGRISPLGGIAFVGTLAVWAALLFVSPWPTLGVTAAVAVLLGILSALSARGGRPPKR